MGLQRHDSGLPSLSIQHELPDRDPLQVHGTSLSSEANTSIVDSAHFSILFAGLCAISADLLTDKNIYLETRGIDRQLAKSEGSIANRDCAETADRENRKMSR